MHAQFGPRRVVTLVTLLSKFLCGLFIKPFNFFADPGNSLRTPEIIFTYHGPI